MNEARNEGRFATAFEVVEAPDGTRGVLFKVAIIREGAEKPEPGDPVISTVFPTLESFHLFIFDAARAAAQAWPHATQAFAAAAVQRLGSKH